MYNSMASSPVASGPSRSLKCPPAFQKPFGLRPRVDLGFGVVEAPPLGSVVRRERWQRVTPIARDVVAHRKRADNGLPMGWWIHEPPRSTGVPARSMVWSRPPMRSRASSTTHSMPARRSREAAASPAIPAPMTTTRLTGPSISLTGPYFRHSAKHGRFRPLRNRRLAQAADIGTPTTETVIDVSRACAQLVTAGFTRPTRDRWSDRTTVRQRTRSVPFGAGDGNRTRVASLED